jgi:phage terminase large subunit GpA-like protein
LVFQQNTSTGEGHFMQWPEDKPREAYFVCSKNGCTIEHKGKRALINAGEWRASKPFTGHASFHIWTAYSFAPNATWGHIAEEFLTAKRDGREALRAFINTTLGETWRESGEAPDWERLYHQREKYPIGIVPPGVKFLTCGVDVQKDRFVFEIVGWGVNRESWSINQGVIPGDTSDEKTWTLLDDLLTTPIPDYTGGMRQLLMMAVDSGYNTQEVYNFARTHERSAVMAVKGDASARAMVKPPTPVDVTVRGVRFARGAKVFPVGVDITKAELYGFLRLRVPIAAPSEPLVYPPGFCHFPEYDEAFFKQLTSEHLVTVTKRTGHMIHEWQLLPGRENHFLDCRVYARAAAHVKGVDRMITRLPPPVGLPPVAPLNPAPPQAKPVAPPRERRERSTFFGGRGKGWLGR